MDSTVRSRPTHYELLGLTPEAKLDEIDEAFARELRLPRAFGSLAEFTVAYETLRDPIRRKAYDASIERKPEPRPALSLAGRLEGAALGAAPAKPIVRIKPPPPPPVVLSRLQPEPLSARRTAPSATALLHQPVTPTVPQRDPTPQTKQEDRRQPDPIARPAPEPRTVGEEIFRPAVDPAEPEREGEFRWKLPALAAGALILAIGGGAWMGVESGNDSPEDQLKPAVSLKVPPAKAAAPIAAASADEAPSIADPQSEGSTRAAASTPKEPVRPPLQIDLPDEQPSELAALEQQQRDIEQADAPAPASAVATASAKMPLPNSVIASTIRRIGYACGEVASTVPIEGAAAGVFKVTCTSGHSYRAAPVNGRYRFRRLSGR